ncbi:hypothetical protein CN692_13515 [Bacillus sp. AFS002410]|uniref:hypothetical protein n=1 Tax=Bacillus sp. AFS002410 TaxID=2033481 RepID=UPI000BEF6B40|nr:hypothetical protein [Bacillus sp. AFS002410]PEJ57166.1 hypothetical protein CN692_13515 [Bacillus sp. AFS002410]
MKKIPIIIALVMLISFPIKSQASSLKQLPITENTNQWKLSIDKAITGPNLTKAKPGVYNTYSLKINNIGDQKIQNVRVEAFRNEPGSKTMFELFTSEDKNVLASRKSDFHHQNFPISVKATVLEIDITWEKVLEQNNVRHFKETFIFEQ